MGGRLWHCGIADQVSLRVCQVEVAAVGEGHGSDFLSFGLAASGGWITTVDESQIGAECMMLRCR